jgi:hypothetical protein
MILELAVLIGTVGGLSAPSWAPKVASAVRRRFGKGGVDVKSARYRLGTDVPGPVPQDWLRFGGARPELRGAPANSILAVPGLGKQSPAVRAALLDIAEQLQIPVDSLATVIAHESGWNERATNPLGAYGLIQLTRGANLPGFQGDAVARVLQLDAVQQLSAVAMPYFARAGAKVRGAHPGALAMENFVPRDFGQPEDYVIAEKDGKDAKIYEANVGLAGAAGGRKDQITVGDVYAHIAKTSVQAQGQRVAVDGAIVAAPKLLGSAPVTTASPPVTATVPKSAPAPVTAPVPKVAPVTAPVAAPASSTTAGGYTLGHAPVKQVPEFAGADPGQLKLGPARKDPRQSGDNGFSLDRMAAPPDADADTEATGAEIRVAGSTIHGLMLAAVQDGAHEEPIWTPLDLPQHDLRVFVLHSPLRCRVGGRWLMLGMSYAELIEVCRRLAGGIERNGGALPPTAEIVDAAWQRAKAEGHLLQPQGLVQDANDQKRMTTIEFAQKHNDNVEKQIARMGSADVFCRDYGKDLVIDPLMLTLGMAEYGWRQPSGTPVQPLGSGGHSPHHTDYSLVCANIVQRAAEKLSTREPVDLADVYESWFGHIDGMTAEIARFL